MKEFFIKLSENSIYKKLMKEPLTYVAGAALLAVLQIAHLASLGRSWGVTSAFANWGAWLGKPFGLDAGSWPYFANMQKTLENGFLRDGASLRNVGVIVGAMLATLFASQFKVKMIKAPRQIVAAILGGLLMGYGARIAAGCNIGNLFSGTISLSLSGWVFMIFLAAGAYVGGKLLVKFFM